MTPKVLNHQSREVRAPARSLQTETIDEIDESLIETFPASDPPAWVALARVGIPKRRKTKSSRARKA
ncbi:hypothetical protein SAMN05444164_4024 [Bradyrhizobium erythrophlei]|uniref:Uncharacterized protein n=1 Tax=Bradyrhizobium erythrophlei TaxID=1437360 RepID=A0A1H4YNC5_9BRAD|nr:hypothetical protein SAMN05444164_4024 [Bradyrhizobium erythrophlei]